MVPRALIRLALAAWTCGAWACGTPAAKKNAATDAAGALADTSVVADGQLTAETAEPAPEAAQGGPDFLFAGPVDVNAEGGQYLKPAAWAIASPASRFALPPTTPTGEHTDPKTGQKVWVLPNGRLVTPAGKQVFLGAYPMGVALHPNGTFAYVANTGKTKAIQVVDLASGQIVQTVGEAYIYRWLSWSPDQQHLYASGGPKSPSFRYQVGADGKLKKDKTYAAKYGCLGLRPSTDGKSVYCAVLAGALHPDDKVKPGLWRIDAVSGEVINTSILPHIPYDLAVSADKWVYAVAWMPGVVYRIDTQTWADPTPSQGLHLGFNAQGLALAPDGKRLYASSVEGDFVAVIDAENWGVLAKISLNLSQVPGLAPQGRDPGFIGLSPDGGRLYVVCAMSNEVVVVDTKTLAVVGSIPVGWYPSGVAVDAKGQSMVVVNGKGTGFPKGWADTSLDEGYLGTLSHVTIPGDAQLAAWQADVYDNLLGVSGLGRVPASAAQQVALPESGPGPIQHVIYLLRENKTFDVELGDLAGEITGVTADPKLALFGEEYTPNLHSLAKEYCLLDNFYTDGDYSATGHSYATAGKASDYVEKHYKLADKGADITWGVGFGSRPGKGFFFQHLMAHGLSVASFGEIVGMADAFSLTNILQSGYPGLVFALGVPDIDKATWFAEHIKGKDLPHFAVISVPANHTCCGGDPEHVSPKSMIADNDEATGVIIEALSLHKDWTSTVVFIFEDDPQDGGDSVEYHRSPLIVVSPWVKRGTLNKTHHAIGSIHATMRRALDVLPLTELDALASPIYGCFGDKPDATPYQHVPRLYPTTANKDEKKKKWTKAMHKQWLRIGPKSFDDAPGLGRLLWEMYKGTPAPWPWTRYSPFEAEDDDE
ncbi:MAG: hypothetical protein FJ100_02165 [Deltaproteobacteria bacterium]|nr:hypothetical protein [Deltaproteobacteria bacterium]